MDTLIKEIGIWNYTRDNTEFKRGHEYRMLNEELNEFLHSTNEANELKELADIIFVAVGSLYKAAGGVVEAEKVMRAVVDANYSKGSEKVKGKVTKGTEYVCPEKVIGEMLQSKWDSYLNDNEHVYGN